MKVNVNLKKDMVFEGIDSKGLNITMDASPEAFGQNAGPPPMKVVLMALGGCTSMDVMFILRKIRDRVERYNLEITANNNPKHPKVFTAIHLIYNFWGKELPSAEVKKAVQLSLERYCPVNAMLSKTAEITHEIRINDETCI